MTLENYVERYLPLSTCKIVYSMMSPLFKGEGDEEKMVRLDRQVLRQSME